MNCLRAECHVKERFAENKHTHVVTKRLSNHADVAGTAFVQGSGDGHHALLCILPSNKVPSKTKS